LSIFVINAGSSSLKFSIFDADAYEMVASGLIDWGGNRQQAELIISLPDTAPVRSQIEVPDHKAALAHVVRSLADAKLISGEKPSLMVVGHRVVHGGATFRNSIRIDAAVKAEIARLGELAPLHNPPALEAIQAAENALPGVPQVAVFDTAFYSQLPPSAYVYPLPYQWYADWGIRRFGFHGISHAYCADRAVEILRRDSDGLRIVSCHLGNGGSATAIRGGIALATTMGFTPMEGLMMGTRSGSVDPGILLHLQQRRGLTAEQLDHALNHDSGLLGVSGVSSDYRQVEAAAQGGHERARLALEIYAERVRATIGALAVTLGGVDALVFTAGVGENAASLRATVCEGLTCLGLRLDPQQNDTCCPDADIATDDSPARILVIRAREDLMIAREARRVALEMSSVIFREI